MGAQTTLPSMERWVGLVLVGSVALALLAAGALAILFALQPTSFRIARSRTIAAPPSAIRAVLSDMRTFSGVAAALGAPDSTRIYTPSPGRTGPGAWFESHGRDGTSRLSLVSETDALVEFRTRNDGVDGALLRFELRPLVPGTEVTIVLMNEMHGLARALWPFVGLEGRVGPDMEDALLHLESAVLAR